MTRMALPWRFGSGWGWTGAAAALALPLGAWAAVGTSGCSGAGANLGCTVAGDCGGNPEGAWFATSVCQFIPPLSYTANALFPQQTAPQTPKLATPPPSNKPSGDWCSQLLYSPEVSPLTGSHVGFVNLFHAPAPVVFATVIMTPDHAYNYAQTAASPNEAHFAPTCLTSEGANPSCTDLAAGVEGYYSSTPNFAPQSFVCTPASDGGCDCSYSFEIISADQGVWQTVGNTLTFFSNQSGSQPITTTTFCASGGTLTMTGVNGQSMFSLTGLRTLFMAQALDGGS
jgi:hypothetical protein